MPNKPAVDVIVFFDPAQKTEFQKNLSQALDVLGQKHIFYSRWEDAANVFDVTNHSYKLVVLDPMLEGFYGRAVQTYLETRDAGNETSVLLCCPKGLSYIAELGIDCFEDLVCSDGRLVFDSLPYEIAFALKRVFFKKLEDCRNSPRAVTWFTVYFSTAQNPEPQRARALNLSKGGLFIETDQPLPERSFLNLRLELPDQKPPIECTGRVAYYHEEKTELKGIFPSGVGIEFKGINEDDQWRIYHHVHPRLLRIDRRRYLEN